MKSSTGENETPTSTARDSLAAALSKLTASKSLRQRRFTMLPLDGPAAPVTRVQGRMPGDSTTPAELEGLISSIATVGVLQPLLIEDNDGRHILVAGERRLRALRWGHVNQPNNPHFQAVPAVVCPGPLTEEERRCWQLVENLAREDLGAGELAAALLFERAAVLAEALRTAGIDIPDTVMQLEDPIARWSALEKLRTGNIGAPWEDVLKRIGIQMSADKAKLLVRAFKALPAEMSSEMDAEGIALATRLDFLKLHKGRAEAASDIWAAVKAKGAATRLLPAAMRAAMADPDLNAEDAVELSEQLHQAANESRSMSLQRNTSTGPDHDSGPVEEVNTAIVDHAVEALTVLNAELRGGKKLGGYAKGTMLLHTRELLTLTRDGAVPA
ncbi:ParB/RepB/Spo0J family partition protein [Mycobacteroides abscessus]|uniref:ParB/RepB/Spo0J family partition protein n=1 Tax=Mycobacteroides abscessus TaxID=36809 RepID=UPI00192E541A|nr:ParB/RepB/Spo0J family partition protein [Mycobacteroides abscessus]MDO3208884.1 ParB/RepB/Spo0J family partition protein [Mycobacteroides abscessus subsp. massiliense]